MDLLAVVLEFTQISNTDQKLLKGSVGGLHPLLTWANQILEQHFAT